MSYFHVPHNGYFSVHLKWQEQYILCHEFFKSVVMENISKNSQTGCSFKIFYYFGKISHPAYNYLFQILSLLTPTSLAA